ncbi:hydroxymethylglutaryl-CoA lyase [Hoyosella subflava]|uniref:Pyruvate carboxyltransferase n=1 Tax=Hoyosella subflava (strain DSM 45089 / JCM 17490 / NBRC 109087 / DQS3-9A1) TaxID=443218 RepID=F6EKJ1_HOYSD|nr:hydroxymethylglutaryl-CoA lyase [Hoyosella subflava]AEF39162.1 Pyruvate carboxyltransferase [Hoyosella subflava DQS3-9A1]
MPDVRIAEVGPRDGLQNLAHEFSVAERIDLINRLLGANPALVEAVSFVNERRVPRMAGAEQILREIERPGDVAIAGLVLNGRGVHRALECELDEIRFAVSATDAFNIRNVNATVEATVAEFAAAVDPLHASGKKLTAVVAVAFGCPFAGPVPAAAVQAVAAQLVNAGADELILADTIGCAVPTQIRSLISALRENWPELPLGLHLHNTRNTGYLNAIVGVESGATTLDASVGGLGGCPFAPNATGNIATEDLAYILRNMGVSTGVDLESLIGTSKWLGSVIPQEISGQVARAGLFPEIASHAPEQRA